MDKLSQIALIRGFDADGVPTNEADNFGSCPYCGQAVDLRELALVLYHQVPGHDPMPLNS